MATLTSTLFGTSISADADLDAIFKASAGTSTAATTTSVKTAGEQKKKKDRKNVEMVPPTEIDTPINVAKKVKKEKKSRQKVAVAEEGTFRETKKKTKKPATADADITSAPTIHQENEAGPSRKRKQADDDDDGKAYVPPQHVSVAGEDKKRKRAKTKYKPAEETREEVDARTVFVGNLPSDMIKNKIALKNLIRHLTASLSAEAKPIVESTRFRSIAFNKSTKGKDVDKESKADAEEDDEEAAAEDEVLNPEKPKYNTAQKKRLAYLRGEFNEQASIVNCYVVFGHTKTSDDGTTPTTMHPADIAKAVVKAADGTTFMEHVLRVDHVGALARTAVSAAANASDKKNEMRRTLFVGGLPFETKEDDLRAFFEAILIEERGQPNKGAEATPGSKKGWVETVRVVRDPDSQLGKGIAYVQLQDLECVDEILALSEDRLSFGKRQIRVQRCKTIARAAPRKPTDQDPTTSPTSRFKKSRRPEVEDTAPVRHGDPNLGKRLSGLSKEKRKEVKASDPDRVARRLEKKKQRVAMGDGKPVKGVGLKTSKDRSLSQKSGRNNRVVPKHDGHIVGT